MNADTKTFRSAVVDRVRASGGVWELPGGQILLPRVFGFCRGVTRALAMLERAVADKARTGKRLFLLGQIIHNPWVNDHFRACGVRVLSPEQMTDLSGVIAPDDCAVVPAFGVPLAIEEQLRRIGCEIVDTTCGDVRRLWAWACRAAQDGFGVLIYGRASHDETVVTKSRLEAAGGRYLVVGELDEARRFCDMVEAGDDDASPKEKFGADASNADSLQPFCRLAQVSQTTMLYDETTQVRGMIRSAFVRRFGAEEAARRLLLQPTVCRATQQRQAAAGELCEAGCHLVIVVGGFGSSNTRHLYELARQRGPAYFIEDASGVISGEALRAFDAKRNSAAEIRDWLPKARPLKVGVLAGASSPEIVVGEVLCRLAELLSS
ncbi:MAG TPA: 4-hydroxy-3-methylbut-2-enyl diphosphate reductase [Phycisphaerae bacterium]|nr:4-hydroxy-3-methylbut-2-enyl diphosphate reductase [Phycisphaerae bacterium]